MVFLNPLFLAGLVAAAIPIIIHLLNLRKVRTIEFSTLSFLKELQKTRIRRIKMRQLLLLILRTLLIMSIVLVFSRPALKTGDGIIGGDAHTIAAILLDNSASMDTYNEHGNVFRQAADYAIAAVDLLREGDIVSLLRQSELPDGITNQPTGDRDRIRQIIRETGTYPIHRDFEQGIKKAFAMLHDSPHLNKEVYIISDMQASHWPEENNDIISIFDNGYRAFIIPVEITQFDNAALHDLSFRSSLFEVGKPITIDIEIRNYGTSDLNNHLVSVYLETMRIAQKTIDLAAGGSSIIDFTITPDQSGILEGYIELEDDALEIDNKYYFTLMIPDRLHVLLVAPTRDDIRFVETALAARGNGSETSAIHTSYVTPDQFTAEDLTRYQSVISVNVPSFSSVQVDRITSYVEQGGGFILFPGDAIDIENYNRDLLEKLRLPEIRNISAHPEIESGRVLFDQIDYDHPIFQDIFEERLQVRAIPLDRVESPRIFRSIEIAQPRTTDISVITLTNGHPFLISGQRGNGTVLFYSIHPGMQWSDFPVRGIYVPLLHRSLLYASATDYINDRYTAGEDIHITISASEAALQAEHILIHPDGMEERIQPQHLAATGTLRFSFTDIRQTGFYRIQRNGITEKGFSINIHHGESTGERISVDNLKNRLELFGLKNIFILERGDNFSTIVQEARHGRELWKMFAFLAFLLAFIETIVARDSKQQITDNQGKLS
jgi:hypothetical protein